MSHERTNLKKPHIRRVRYGRGTVLALLPTEEQQTETLQVVSEVDRAGYVKTAYPIEGTNSETSVINPTIGASPDSSIVDEQKTHAMLRRLSYGQFMGALRRGVDKHMNDKKGIGEMFIDYFRNPKVSQAWQRSEQRWRRKQNLSR